MKKLTALALIAITLTACKKETKTITRVDPKTGKTETVPIAAAFINKNSSWKKARLIHWFLTKEKSSLLHHRTEKR